MQMFFKKQVVTKKLDKKNVRTFLVNFIRPNQIQIVNRFKIFLFQDVYVAKKWVNF